MTAYLFSYLTSLSTVSYVIAERFVYADRDSIILENTCLPAVKRPTWNRYKYGVIILKCNPVTLGNEV